VEGGRGRERGGTEGNRREGREGKGKGKDRYLTPPAPFSEIGH
jgi:hypothetical protein